MSSAIREDGALFSIIADEVTESHSNNRFVSDLCHGMTKYHHNLLSRKFFFYFTFLTRTTGLAISNAIKESLCTYNIDVSKARGQAYDGASAMSSNISGVQARIREAAPLALYTHCRSHVLNLSIAATCQVPEVRNMVDTINSCFNYSPKRQIFFELVLEAMGATTKKKHLAGLCKTRWVERHTCFETFLELYKYLSICLKAISLPHLFPELVLVTPDDPESEKWGWEKNKETKITAQGLHAGIRRPEFIMAF